MNIEQSICKTSRASLPYVRFGSGKKTMVILPGLSVKSVLGMADAIASAYQVFTDEFTVYLFEPRTDLPESYAIEAMAADAAEAFRALGLLDIHLFGASMGGLISMTIAAKNLAPISKLVLGSTAPRADEAAGEVIEKWIHLAEAKDGPGLYQAFGKAVYPAAMYAGWEEMLIAEGRTVTEAEFARFVTLARSVFGFDIREDLPKITCPVLVLGSDDDAIFPPSLMQEIAEGQKKNPGFHMYMYSGFGHAAYDTAPDYKERMLSFFRGGLTKPV